MDRRDVMRKVLLVVDLQPEFKDDDGVYNKILKFVRDNEKDSEYASIVGIVCYNKDGSSFVKYTGWRKLITSRKGIEYNPDLEMHKIGYGLTSYDNLSKNFHYDIVGFNTDACVLKVALDLFDRGYDFSVLSKYCYCRRGKERHENGLQMLRYLVGDAVI